VVQHDPVIRGSRSECTLHRFARAVHRKAAVLRADCAQRHARSAVATHSSPLMLLVAGSLAARCACPGCAQVYFTRGSVRGRGVARERERGRPEAVSPSLVCKSACVRHCTARDPSISNCLGMQHSARKGRARYRNVCGSSPTRSAYSRFTMTLTCRLARLCAGRQRRYASSVLPPGRVAWPDGPTTYSAASDQHHSRALAARNLRGAGASMRYAARRERGRPPEDHRTEQRHRGAGACACAGQGARRAPAS